MVILKSLNVILALEVVIMQWVLKIPLEAGLGEHV